MHVCLYSSAGVGSVVVAIGLLVFNAELPAARVESFHIICPGTSILAWAATVILKQCKRYFELLKFLS